MLNIKLICLGKMKEKHYIAAFAEYEKRLSGCCRFELCELAEARLPQTPSPAEINVALTKEEAAVRREIPSGSFVVAMCIEGTQLGSSELAELFCDCANKGRGRICFLVGSSNGLCEELKRSSDYRLSMSKMTFPHHLARVMLAEQIYRAMMINEGSKYHK